jgi:hypothetical protein
LRQKWIRMGEEDALPLLTSQQTKNKWNLKKS